MITLNWSRFPESDVTKYRVYRSMIGFMFTVSPAIAGTTLVLKMNNGSSQTLTFPAVTNSSTYYSDVITYLNSVLVGGQAYEAEPAMNLIVRSDIRQAPGSVELISGSLLPIIGQSARLITERSESVMIKEIVANVDPTAMETFHDCDGCLSDFYAISSVNSQGIESLKAPWQQPIQSSGDICVVEGTICDLQGVRIADAEVKATLQVPPTRSALTYITNEPIITRTGVDGRFSLPILQGALVRLEIPSISYCQMVTIPCKSYTFLQDLKVDMNYTYPIGYRE